MTDEVENYINQHLEISSIAKPKFIKAQHLEISLIAKPKFIKAYSNLTKQSLIKGNCKLKTDLNTRNKNKKIDMNPKNL